MYVALKLDLYRVCQESWHEGISQRNKGDTSFSSKFIGPRVPALANTGRLATSRRPHMHQEAARQSSYKYRSEMESIPLWHQAQHAKAKGCSSVWWPTSRRRRRVRTSSNRASFAAGASRNVSLKRIHHEGRRTFGVCFSCRLQGSRDQKLSEGSAAIACNDARRPLNKLPRTVETLTSSTVQVSWSSPPKSYCRRWL
jgi:hypothetical protein